MDRSDCQYTDIQMERLQRNTVSNTKTQTIFNKEFTLFSRATSPVQLSVVAFFYCVFKAEIYNEELNLSLLKKIMLGRVVLGFPKPLECTNYFPFQVLTSMVFNGMSLMVLNSRQISSLGWLEPLKPRSV